MTKVFEAEAGPNVSVIVPNLEGELMIEECLRSVVTSVGQWTYEVIVVDNGSSDRSVDVIGKVMPKARIVRNRENRGFAEACNQGAEASRGEFFLFLNNDVVLAHSCLEEMILWAYSDPEAAAWQPKILLADGKSWDSAGSFITRTGFLQHRRGGLVSEHPFDEAVQIFSPKGACMLVRAAAFQEVGGFDASFFCYNEETDLSWRMILKGWVIRYVPISAALHECGKTTRRVLKPSETNFLSFRNRMHSLLRTAETGTLFRVIPVHIAVCVIMIVSFVVRGNAACGWSIVRAIGWNVVHLRITLRERKEIQKSRKVSDMEIFAEVGGRLGVRQTARHALEYLGAYSGSR